MTSHTDTSTPAQSFPQRVLGTLASVIGMAAGYYTWVQLLIPVPIGCAIGFVLWKWRRFESPLMTAAVAVAATEAGWWLVGLAFAPNHADIAVDVALLLLLLTVLLWTRAKLAIYALLAYEVLGAVVHTTQLWAAPFRSIASQASLVHVCINVAVIALAGAFLFERKGSVQTPVKSSA